MRNIKQCLKSVTDKYDHTCRRVAAGSFLMATPLLAMADDTGAFDTSDSLSKIAAGLAAGITISLAFTGAYIGMKASKVPRRGA